MVVIQAVSEVVAFLLPKCFAVVRVKQIVNMVIVAAVMVNRLGYIQDGRLIGYLLREIGLSGRGGRYDKSTLFRGYILPIKSVIILT